MGNKSSYPAVNHLARSPSHKVMPICVEISDTSSECLAAEHFVFGQGCHDFFTAAITQQCNVMPSIVCKMLADVEYRVIAPPQCSAVS